jgi:proteasome accessory factor B
MHPLERLVNLVALLLEARKPLTFEQIRDKLEGYEDANLASAKRKFERDKDILRDIGVPIDLIATDAWDVEEGYVIRKEKYYLPEISFTPEEISALFVAARSVGDGEDGSAEQGARKLLAGAEGGIITGISSGPLAAGGDVPGVLLIAAAEAALQQRGVRFGYRTARGAPSERLVDAYGLVYRSGHWYLVGLDREREEIRAFRLSRVTDGPEVTGEGSAPPNGFRAGDHVQAGPWGTGEPGERARLAFAPEVAWWATSGVPGTDVLGARDDGWVEALVPAGPGDDLASWVLSFGPDAEALEPDWLRAEVLARLEVARAG